MKHPVIKTALIILLGAIAAMIGEFIIHIALWSDISRVLWMLFGLFPLVSLMMGLAFHQAINQVWVAFTAPLAVFIPAIILDLNPDNLIYVPLYMVVCGLGYFLPKWLVKKSNAA